MISAQIWWIGLKVEMWLKLRPFVALSTGCIWIPEAAAPQIIWMNLPSWCSPGWNQSSLSPVRPVASRPSRPGSEPNEEQRWIWRAWPALQVLCAEHVHPSKQQFPERVKMWTFNHNSIKICVLCDVIFTLTEHCCQLVYTRWSVNQHKHALQRQVVTENTGVLLRREGRRHLEKLPFAIFGSPGGRNVCRKHKTQRGLAHASRPAVIIQHKDTFSRWWEQTQKGDGMISESILS